MTKQTMLRRQGDVLFMPIDASAIPKGERKVRKNGLILAGEATGHHHSICEADLEAGNGEVYDVAVKDQPGRCFLSVSAEGGVAIVHQEHAPITLPKGDYEVTRQREYSPQEIRNVQD